jgi:hypothetical protein
MHLLSSDILVGRSGEPYRVVSKPRCQSLPGCSMRPTFRARPMPPGQQPVRRYRSTAIQRAVEAEVLSDIRRPAVLGHWR